MKIMNVFLRGKWGGGELMALNHARALSAYANVCFVASKGSVLAEKLKDRPQVQPALVRTNTDHKIWSVNENTIPDMAQAIATAKPDCVLSQGTSMAGVTKAALDRAGSNAFHIVVMHSEKNETLAQSADAVIVVSEHLKRFAQDAGIDAERIAHVSNFLMDAPGDMPVAQPAHDVPRIGYLGRLSPGKGVEHFIDMLQTLDAREFQFQAMMAGDGIHADIFKAKARDAGVNGKISWLGWVPDQKIGDFFKQIDTLVVPNYFEPFGMIILEAWKHGVPVIAVNCGGPAAIIQHGVNGLLAQPSAQSLADQVQTLAAMPRLRERFAVRAHQTFRDRYHADVMAAPLRDAVFGLYGTFRDTRRSVPVLSGA